MPANSPYSSKGSSLCQSFWYELVYLIRASLVGVINTAIGCVGIFLCSFLGASPYASNGAGYAVGLLCSFFLNRKFVFQGGQEYSGQFKRFILAFIISYAANFLMLHLALRIGAHAILAQAMGVFLYFGCMYAIGRVWVFRLTK